MCIFTKKRSRMQCLKYVSFFLLAIVMVGCDSMSAYFNNEKTINDETTVFYIHSDDDLETVTQNLIDQKIIDDEDAFQAIIDYKEFNSEKLGAGKYEIEPGTEYKNIVNGFTRNRLGNGNKEVEVQVTFNNCQDIKEVAGKVSKQIEMDSAEFVNYLMSDSILKKYGFSPEKIGALFLPNTYRMYWDTDHIDFLNYMAKEFKSFWNPERMELLRNKKVFSGQSDVVTLASIVYKEQDKYPEEWKTIAGLYINRLKKGMKLQSDPTFRFCWGDELDGVERLLNVHKEIDCPYNTYIYTGLPPGPICIPPSSVVDAVLRAEDNSYLFMCAKPDGDGLHNFAKSFSQHKVNAAKFQRWISQQQRANK